MHRSFLSGLLASLLVVTLYGAAITAIVGGTVLNAPYVEGRLAAVHAYARLSAAFINEATQQSGTSNPQVAATLRSILTPAVIKHNVNRALNQLQAYSQGGARLPELDLSGIGAKAQAAGVPLGQDDDLTQPAKLSASNGSKIKHAIRTFNRVRLATIWLSALLAAVLLVISWKRRRYAALPNVLITAGVLAAATAALLCAAAATAEHLAGRSLGFNAFALLGRDLARNIALNLAERFAIVAALCLGVGVTVRILAARFSCKDSSGLGKPAAGISGVSLST